MDEDQEINLEGERARRLKESSDWKWAKDKLDDCIDAVTSIGSLPRGLSATLLQREIDARNKAIGIVKAWIEEVEGSGEQKVINSKTNKEVSEPLVQHFEE